MMQTFLYCLIAYFSFHVALSLFMLAAASESTVQRTLRIFFVLLEGSMLFTAWRFL